MKTLALSFALFAGLFSFATQPQHAPTAAQSRVEQVNDQLVELEFVNPQGQELEVRILGNSGAVLYKRSFTTSSYRVGFDLTLFPEGTYVVEVLLDGKLWKQEEVVKLSPASQSNR